MGFMLYCDLVLFSGVTAKNNFTSIGLVVSQPTEGVLHVLSRADELLYTAKTTGRNRVISSTAAFNVGRNLHST